MIVYQMLLLKKLLLLFIQSEKNIKFKIIRKFKRFIKFL